MGGSGWRVELPWQAIPKKRPVVTRNGTFMPREYTEYKEAIADLMSAFPIVTAFPNDEGVALQLEFWPDKVVVGAHAVPLLRWGQADLDNLIGGIMDAIQNVAYENDRQVVSVTATFRKETE